MMRGAVGGWEIRAPEVVLAGCVLLCCVLLVRAALRRRGVTSKVHPAESTLQEDVKSVLTWFYNLIGPTLKGRPACKPTMPTVIPTVIDEVKQVMHGDSCQAW